MLHDDGNIRRLVFADEFAAFVRTTEEALRDLDSSASFAHEQWTAEYIDECAPDCKTDADGYRIHTSCRVGEYMVGPAATPKQLDVYGQVRKRRTWSARNPGPGMRRHLLGLLIRGLVDYDESVEIFTLAPLVTGR